MTDMAGFPKLADFLVPPPGPALIAVFMVMGLKYLGSRLLRRFHLGGPTPDQAAAGFILATAGVAAVANFLALAGEAYIWPLRLMAWFLVLCGIRELSHLKPATLSNLLNRIKGIFEEESLWGKAAIILLVITVVGLLLAALGPPTDADSLDYHLGVPLDILRHHMAYPRPDWLHARLTGLGESLNMLGLAGGTDCFGAMLQFAGLIAATVAVNSLAATDRDRILLSICILGCPLVDFLVPNQKPQMLPIAATTIALILIARRFREIDPTTLILSLGSVFFAIACRYTFILTGGIVVMVGLLAAYRARLLAIGLGLALAAYVLLAFPVHLRNLLFYGDPISPFLERFRPVSDPVLISFANYLRNLRPESFLPVPLSLIIPTSLGTLTTVLGLGPLMFLVALGEIRTHLTPRILLICAMIAIAALLTFSQAFGRFFFEPYLWVIAAVAASAWGSLKRFLFKLMVVQLALMALVAVFGAVTLFPGALTASWRQNVMARSAYCYLETCWLDQVLPQDAVVLPDIRSMALMPRPFLSRDILLFYNLADPPELTRFLSMAKASNLNTLVLSSPPPKKLMEILGPYLAGPLDSPRKFHLAVRNPWNRGPEVNYLIYRFHFPKGEH